MIFPEKYMWSRTPGKKVMILIKRMGLSSVRSACNLDDPSTTPHAEYPTFKWWFHQCTQQDKIDQEEANHLKQCSPLLPWHRQMALKLGKIRQHRWDDDIHAHKDENIGKKLKDYGPEPAWAFKPGKPWFGMIHSFHIDDPCRALHPADDCQGWTEEQ